MKIAQVMMDDAWGGVHPGKLEEGVGGREQALLRLAKQWAAMGHEVTCFVPTPKTQRYDDPSGGSHTYVDRKVARTILSTLPYDAVVAWECGQVYDSKALVELQKIRLVGMQCAHFIGAQLGFFAERQATEQASTGIVALSQWHKDFLLHDGLSYDPDSIHVMPNCVDMDMYRTTMLSGRRNEEPKFFYSSSPDRGLWNLLKAWPTIRSYWPGAELRVAYGVEKWLAGNLWSHYANANMAIELLNLMGQPGVIDVGTISPAELAKIQESSDALLYPCDTMAPTETGCITVMEAMAAGAPAVITDADCLGEEFSDYAVVVPLPFEIGSYVGALGALLEDQRAYNELQGDARHFVETERTWEGVASKWIELFEGLS